MPRLQGLGITLDDYTGHRPVGKGRKRGEPKFGRRDPLRVEVDGPSPPVAKFLGCPPGCDCQRCRIDREHDAKLFADTASFREEAALMSRVLRERFRRTRRSH